MITQTRLTVKDFMALPDDGKRYELFKGELVEMPGPGGKHGAIISRLDRRIGPHLQSNNLGEIFVDTAFQLDPNQDTVRRPDLAFIALDRLKDYDDIEEAIDIAPDLAVEVVSPSDISYQIDEKVDEYLLAGVRLVWVIRPRRKVVEVYRQGQVTTQVLNLQDELDGENVVPGFKMLVSSLFARQ